MSHTSIKIKIILTLLIIVVGTLSCFEVYDYYEEQQKQSQVLSELAKQKAVRLAHNLKLPLWELDHEWVNETLATEMQEEPTYAILVHADGGLFAGTARDKSWVPVKSLNHISGDFIVQAHDILHEEEKIGSVRVYISRKFMLANLSSHAYADFLSMLLVSALLIFCLIIAMERIVTKPLDSILKVVKRMSTGDYSHDILIKKNDEIGAVAAGFNLLRNSVQEREAALQQSEERIRLLLESTGEGIYGLDLEGVCTFANKMCLMLLGYQHTDELTGKHMHTLIHHTRRDGSYYPVEECQIYKAFREGGGTHADDEVFWRSDGSSFPAEYHSFPIKKNGTTIGSVVTFLDISERKLAEEKVHILSSSVEQAKESIVITDMQGTIKYANPAFSAITGYAEQDVIDQNQAILKRMNHDDDSYQQMSDAITSGHSWHGRGVDRKKDGSTYPSMLTVAPIRSESGSITHYVETQQDLTEHENLEIQLRQAQKMEAVGTLVAGIAHDFNNTLAGITGNIYLAKNSIKNSPETLKRLESIERLSHRAANMVQQLLTFSRKGVVNMKQITISSFLKEITKMHEVALPENIKLRQLIESSNMQIRGDINQLQQVIMNLLNNARDAVMNVNSPEITLKLEQFTTDDQFKISHPNIVGKMFARISVIDNGSGIKKEVLSHIFEPFFTTKEVGKGTGLGLAMSYGAIQSHDGFITVESEVGKGSSFYVYLPLLMSDGNQAVNQAEEKVVHGHGETILLVDDDEEVIKTGHDVLESLGYKVLLASDGLNAVEVYKTHSSSINLIILDMVMPRMGGVEAAKVIREINESAKVIFVTGYDSNQRLDADSMASEKILSKPSNVPELSQVIQATLISS